MTFQVRRGLDSDRIKIIPAEGELIYATDTKKLYVGDGITWGGVLVNYLKNSIQPTLAPYTPPITTSMPTTQSPTTTQPPITTSMPTTQSPTTTPVPTTTAPLEIYTYSLPNFIEIGHSFFINFTGKANIPFEYSIRLANGKNITGNSSLSYSSGFPGALGTSRVEVLGFNVTQLGNITVSVIFKDPIRGNVVGIRR